MPKSALAIRLRTPLYALVVSLGARVALAQNAPASAVAPSTPSAVAPAVSAAPASPPAASAEASQAAGPAAAVQQLSAPPSAPPAVDVAPAQPAGTPPATQPGAPSPTPVPAEPAPAPVPTYGRLGGQPAPEPEPGGWDPWAHPVPGRFEHSGFFLRLNAGPTLYGDVSRPDDRFWGQGYALALSIGGSLVENLALHADFQLLQLPSPTERANHVKKSFDADITLQSFGLGATYYLMPVNLYVSAGVGLGVLVFENDTGASKQTSGGLTLKGTVGKEWWVGAEWGLGVAGQIIFMRVKDYVDSAHMNAYAISLLVSATAN